MLRQSRYSPITAPTPDAAQPDAAAGCDARRGISMAPTQPVAGLQSIRYGPLGARPNSQTLRLSPLQANWQLPCARPGIHAGCQTPAATVEPASSGLLDVRVHPTGRGSPCHAIAAPAMPEDRHRGTGAPGWHVLPDASQTRHKRQAWPPSDCPAYRRACPPTARS